MSLEKEEQERHELRKMIMGCSSNDDLRKRDKKKMDDDDSMQFSSTGQPGVMEHNIHMNSKENKHLFCLQVVFLGYIEHFKDQMGKSTLEQKLYVNRVLLMLI